MKITRLPLKVNYISAGDKMISFPGLKLVADTANRLGILSGLNRVGVKKRRRGIPTADFIMSLVDNFLVGGSHLTDLEALRSEKATRAHLYDLEVPAPTTAGEFLRKFSVGHIKQLERVIGNAVVKGAELIGGAGVITLDLDSSIFEVYGLLKEGAHYSYKKVWGFHPLLCFWAEQRLLVGAKLRPGNRNSDYKATSFIAGCLSRLPKDSHIRMRMDSGFYNKKIIAYLLDKGVEFSVSGKLTTALNRAIEAVGPDQWKPYPWEKDAHWCEFPYHPKDWPGTFRMIVKRVPHYEGNQRVIGEFRYNPVLTNRKGAGSSLIKHHLGRGGAENYIEEFKNGLGASHLPSHSFSANWAWLVIAQLAYNLAQWLKLLVLPGGEVHKQLKHLRLHWLCVAARIIHSGRRRIVALARSPDDAARFNRAQAIIFAL